MTASAPAKPVPNEFTEGVSNFSKADIAQKKKSNLCMNEKRKKEKEKRKLASNVLFRLFTAAQLPNLAPRTGHCIHARLSTRESNEASPQLHALFRIITRN